MAKVILITLLSVGGLFCHILSVYTVRKVKNIYALIPLNLLMFFAFFVIYFFAVSTLESALTGTSEMYDVEALIFFMFAIIFSIVSSAFHVRAIKRTKKLQDLV